MTTADYKGIQVYVLSESMSLNKALIMTVDGRKAFGSDKAPSKMAVVPADQVMTEFVHAPIVQS
jgi:hypothetical protein